MWGLVGNLYFVKKKYSIGISKDKKKRKKKEKRSYV
jgi:hypothetical protein